MSHPKPARKQISVRGVVQGVGFRPFVYRLAHEHALDGHVRNLRGDVEIVVAGPASRVESFERDLIERAPPLAQPRVRSAAGG